MSAHLQDDKNLVEHLEDVNVSYNNVALHEPNPLVTLSTSEVLELADAFVDAHGFQADREIFRKGALVAQAPHHTSNIAALSEKEKADLDYERAHKWRLPWKLYYAVIICAIGAATQGWDQTGSNAANLSFPAEFGIDSSIGQPGGARDEWIVGFINAAPNISATLLGVWLSDPFNNWFGRRGEIFISGLILIATPIASGFTHSWQALAAVRLVMGVGIGMKSATVAMFSAELAPASVRGALTMGWQLWVAFGIFAGFCANAAVKDAGKITWRLQLGSAFIPAVPLVLGVLFCVESPRWYMKKGRMADAWNAMRKIRNTDVQAARDLFYANVLQDEERKILRGRTYITRFTELFSIPRCRRALGASSMVMLAQQMCGINIMGFYSSTIFTAGGFTAVQALYASIGFGALNFVFAIPAVFTIDRFGRRTLLLWTFPNMCWTLLAGGFCFYIKDVTTRTALVAFFVYLFTIAYSVGEGPVPYLYAAEVFPLAQREQGMAWSVAFNAGWASVLGLTFPRLLRTLGTTSSFGFYAGLNLGVLKRIHEKR
ncbi:hypothetical protein C362_01004 [Cryptococcus neoformans Bt1]|nr:hypothetical protein C362_01004 [Cryptococcus neoformans var. grubii Bt1]